MPYSLIELFLLPLLYIKAKGELWNGMYDYSYKKWAELFKEYPTDWKIYQFKRF